MSKKESNLIAPPKNSIISWLYTLVWETFTGVVGYVIIIGGWSAPHPGVLLGLFLAGFFINLILLLVTIFVSGWSNKGLTSIINKGLVIDEVTQWVYWAFDQTHFVTNMIFYLANSIFYGIFIGIRGGFLQFQPLLPVTTSVDIENMVMFKIFALLLVLVAGANYYFNFSTSKYVIIKMLHSAPQFSQQATTNRSKGRS